MPTIKNHLIRTFNKGNIPALIRFHSKNYRPFDLGEYLYGLITKVNNSEKFSDDFIELTYTTLISWNMNQRGAKLSEISTFKNSLIEQKSNIESLGNLRLNSTSESSVIKEKIQLLFEKLILVAEGKPKLVTFSKTLHFFLPDLLMPIDRSYTLMYFYNHTNLPKSDKGQLQIYCDVFDDFKELSIKCNFEKYLVGRWNKNIPKIIDNIIIAYIQNKRKR